MQFRIADFSTLNQSRVFKVLKLVWKPKNNHFVVLLYCEVRKYFVFILIRTSVTLTQSFNFVVFIQQVV